MKVGIFSRVIMGYMAIISLLVASNIYGIFKLRQFSANTLQILNIDVRILDYEKKLVDSLFSQFLYEKKFIITRDVAMRNQSLSAMGDFHQLLIEASRIADTPLKEQSLNRIRKYHERYEYLVNHEAEQLMEHRVYSRKWYEDEKGKASDGMLQELGDLESHSRGDIYKRAKVLNEGGDAARKLAIAFFLVAVLLALSGSFLITRSITKPLATFAAKTREVSRGIFKSDLQISSPPEISELTKAFNVMCERLKAVDKMKLDFFSVMSHELRTPLTSIREGTSLLLESPGGMITERQIRLLNILSIQTERMIDLVNSVLDFSKMEAGMMTYTFEQGKITPLLEQTMMEIAPLVEAKRITFGKEVSAEIPLVRMDVDRVLQVLRNLIGNAIKFTPENGRITIAAAPVKSGVQVSITDTGPGVPEQNLITIFEKFRSMDHTRGTGLGLAIVKHIVTAHGGKIWAESKLGEGSTFFFVLPS